LEGVIKLIVNYPNAVIDKLKGTLVHY